MTRDKERTSVDREGASSPADFRARRLLTRELADLVERLDGLPPLEAEALRGDEADRIQARDEHDLGVADRARLQARRGLLMAAIDRLIDGTYGLCLDCGATIAPARLRALPEVALCLGCQAELERSSP